LRQRSHALVCSIPETEDLLILSRDLGYLSSLKAKPILMEIDQIERMLSSLHTPQSGSKKQLTESL
jgi:hypothetical protein